MPVADVVAQEEIKLFKLSDLSGTFSAGYWLDERSDESVSGGATAKATSWQEKLLLRARSYVYHQLARKTSIACS
jgi:hypothetical protein